MAEGATLPPTRAHNRQAAPDVPQAKSSGRTLDTSDGKGVNSMRSGFMHTLHIAEILPQLGTLRATSKHVMPIDGDLLPALLAPLPAAHWSGFDVTIF